MQMRLTAAALVLTLAHEAIAAETGCPIITPAGAWIQGSVHTAVSAGKPIVDLPLIHQGFNRTVTIDGLCEDAFTVSSAFTCSGLGGEFRATMTAGPAASPVKLRFGAASCPLTAISVHKTAPKSRFEAEMRFQFEGCVGAPVTTAAVVVGIHKDTEGADFNLLPWTKEVCKIQDATTPPSSATVSQETDAVMQMVGAGKCVGTERRQINNIKDNTACKLQCVGSTTKAHILGGTGCTGFNFKAGAKGANCITYSGSIVAATEDKADAGWECYNMSFKTAQYSKSTPPPVILPKDTSELLDIKSALDNLGEYGYMQQISPPVAAPTCFSPMWWFTMQNRAGQPSSVPVKAADWDALMELVPKPEFTKSVVSAPQIIDRVVIDTCPRPVMKGKEAAGWSTEACVVPAVKKTECREEEVTGAIVSGVITSLLTWIFVGITFYVYKTTFKGKGDYEALSEPGQGARFCQTQILVLLSLVTLIGAFLSCYLSTQFLEAVLSSSGCYDVDEFLVVILAVVLAVSFTILLILHYMAVMHPSHPHPMVATSVAGAKPKNTQLMLVQVEDGKSVGHALDTMTATQEGNVFTSFRSGGSDPAGSPMTSNMGGPMASNTTPTR